MLLYITDLKYFLLYIGFIKITKKIHEKFIKNIQGDLFNLNFEIFKLIIFNNFLQGKYNIEPN